MKWALLILAVGMVARAEDKPATRPAKIDTSPYIAKVAAADRASTVASADAIAKWRASEEYRSMKADADSKREALEAARAGDDAKAKLDASKAYNDARIKLEKADGADHSTEESRAARAELSKAHAALREVTEQNRKIEEADAINQAIAKRQFVVGMTLEQARKCASGDGEKVFEERGMIGYRFVLVQQRGELSARAYDVYFQGGKATSVQLAWEKFP